LWFVALILTSASLSGCSSYQPTSERKEGSNLARRTEEFSAKRRSARKPRDDQEETKEERIRSPKKHIKAIEAIAQKARAIRDDVTLSASEKGKRLQRLIRVGMAEAVVKKLLGAASIMLQEGYTHDHFYQEYELNVTYNDRLKVAAVSRCYTEED